MLLCQLFFHGLEFLLFGFSESACILFFLFTRRVTVIRYDCSPVSGPYLKPFTLFLLLHLVDVKSKMSTMLNAEEHRTHTCLT